MTKLSEDTGLVLFERQGRGLRLTEAGEVLFQSCRRAFTDLEQTMLQLQSRTSETGPIILSCERSLAMRWLISRLGRFQDENSDISVHLSVGGGSLNLSEGGPTIAVRRFDFPLSPEWCCEPLFEEKVGPVMNDVQLRRFESGSYISLGTKTRPDAWDSWLLKHPEVARPQEIRFFDHHFLMVEAVAAGLGVGLCPMIMAVDDTRRGRLHAPMGFEPDGSVYGLIYLQRRMAFDAAQRLIAWLHTVFDGFEADR